MVQKPANIGDDTPEKDIPGKVGWKRRDLPIAPDKNESQTPSDVILQRMRDLLAKKLNPDQNDARKPA